VTGYDGSAKGQHREIPSGLRLIDTRTWTVRQVDRHSSSAVLAAGRLLAFGTAFGTGPNDANQGYGLTLYGPGDRQPVHWFGAKQVSWIQVNGEFAYVQLMDANLPKLRQAAPAANARVNIAWKRSPGPHYFVPDARRRPGKAHPARPPGHGIVADLAISLLRQPGHHTSARWVQWRWASGAH
jgi:hypothetical protein